MISESLLKSQKFRIIFLRIVSFFTKVHSNFFAQHSKRFFTRDCHAHKSREIGQETTGCFTEQLLRECVVTFANKIQYFNEGTKSSGRVWPGFYEDDTGDGEDIRTIERMLIVFPLYKASLVNNGIIEMTPFADLLQPPACHRSLHISLWRVGVAFTCTRSVDQRIRNMQL